MRYYRFVYVQFLDVFLMQVAVNGPQAPSVERKGHFHDGAGTHLGQSPHAPLLSRVVSVGTDVVLVPSTSLFRGASLATSTSCSIGFPLGNDGASNGFADTAEGAVVRIVSVKSRSFWHLVRILIVAQVVVDKSAVNKLPEAKQILSSETEPVEKKSC